MAGPPPFQSPHFGAVNLEGTYCRCVLGFFVAAVAGLALASLALLWFKRQYERTSLFPLTGDERQKVVLSFVMNRSIWMAVGSGILGLLILSLAGALYLLGYFR